MNDIEQERLYGLQNKILLIQRLGGRFVTEARFFSTPCRVGLGDINRNFKGLLEFENWVIKDLIPQLRQLGDKEFVQFLSVACPVY